MLIRKKCLKIQERLGMRIGVAYGSKKTPIIKTPDQALEALETFYKTGFKAFLLPREMFAGIANTSDLYKEHYNALLKIKTIASKYNIELAAHNHKLSGDQKLDEEIKIYANVANVMDLRSLILHPNFYRNMPQDQSLKLVVYKINEIVNEIRIRSKIGIETTGNVRELGSVEDVVDMVKRTRNTEPVFNWAHIHARSSGALTSEVDFRRILDKTRSEVGQGWLSEAYFIFSGVSYGPTGATAHKPLKNADIHLEHLIKNIQSLNIKGTLIFETPGREKDVLDILQQLGDMVR
jgi:deoxyribonuclease-4